MATYQFSFITSSEAMSYSALADDLRFDGVSGATATTITVLDGFTVRTATGSSVRLGSGAAGDRLSLPDGSILVLPGSGEDIAAGGAAGDHLYGGAANDSLSGLAGADVLDGGAANDTLNGGAGADTLIGGALYDTFVFAANDSGTVEGQIDTILDWEPGFEKLVFSNGLSGAVYAETTAPTYASALAAANAQIASGAADVVAVAVGSDVFVFADTRNNNGVADDAIRLVGTNLNYIDAVNIVSGSGGASPTQPGDPPAGPDAHAGAETLTAPSGGGSLSGGGGDDFLIGSFGGDLLDGGDGADTIDAKSGADTIFGGAGADVVTIGDGDKGLNITLGPGADLLRMTGFAQFEDEIPRILDFTWNEDAIRFVYTMGGTYGEGVASSFAGAQTLANRMWNDGYRTVSVQVAGDVFVFGVGPGSSRFTAAVRLVDRTLDDVSGVNLGFFTAPTINDPAGISPAPARATTGTVVVAGDMDAVDVGVLGAEHLGQVTETRIVLDGPKLDIILTGTSFTTDTTRTELFGAVTGFALGSSQGGGTLQINATVAPKELGGVIDGIDAHSTTQLFNYVFSGSDQVSGSAGADVIRAYFGDDVIMGYGGGDTIYGGGGNDVIYSVAPLTGGGGSTYLRGDDGNDWILGGDGFDDINGNMGNDIASGGGGNDWVVGGKDGDVLFGDAGDDLVYGNNGSDKCYGGEGNDTVRGGQDGDLVSGGAGDDFLSGDRGNDTMIGGAGADIFHSFVGTDSDRIEDFNFAEGDRVMLLPGTQFTLEQVGPDTVVGLVGGGRILMMGITAANLPNGWVFFGG